MNEPGASATVVLDDDLELILAAGGLLWRGSGSDRRLAVVRRARYGDWTLPKGKVRRGETPRQAALREVGEETGCAARIGGFAGTVCYEVEGQPKLVLFWTMAVADECGPPLDDEVAEVVWLSPERALRRLDYPGERALLARCSDASAPQGGPERPAGPGLRDRWNAFFKPWSQRRLDAALRGFAAELEWRTATAPLPLPAWARTADRLLREARDCSRRGRVDEGWHSLMAAQRLEAFALDAPERAVRADALRAEASRKLVGWRRRAIMDALPRGRVPAAAALWYASLIRDENAQNEYRKLAVQSDQLAAMGILVGMLLTVLLLLAGIHPIPLDYASYAGSFELLVYVVVFGMLGGAVSTMIPRPRRGSASRIPEHLAEAAFGRLRPLIGGACAVVIYLSFAANVVPVQLTGERGAVVLLLAFAAGFSERLVLRAVERISGRGSDADSGAHREPDEPDAPGHEAASHRRSDAQAELAALRSLLNRDPDLIVAVLESTRGIGADEL